MTKFNFIPRFACLLLAGFSWYVFTSCSETTFAGATDMPNENSVTVTGVVEREGEPAEGVVVTIYPDNFNPVIQLVPDTLRAITGSEGEYLVRITNPGLYNIQFVQLENQEMALVRDLAIPELTNVTVQADTASLEAPGSISLNVDQLEQSDNGYIYVPGTGLSKSLIEDDFIRGFINLRDAPVSTYSEITYSAPSLTREINLLESEVAVEQGEVTLVEPYQGWSMRKKITVNTTGTGADISEDVYHFPMLVRLNGSAGVTGGVEGDGSDIRFTKSDGFTPLAFEIDTWDIDNNSAVIWVKMDTVFADNNSQFIYMYSGKTDAVSLSSGAAVYDTANGFAGVWHLGEGNGKAPQPFMDATANENHARRQYQDSPLDNQGIIGQGLKFPGGQWGGLEVDTTTSLDFSGSSCIQAWVRQDSVVPGFREAGIFKKDDVIRYSIVGEQDSSMIQHQVLMYGEHINPRNYSATALAAGPWYHMAVVIDGASATFYRNGVPDGSMPLVEPIVEYPRPVYIGTGHGEDFFGVIDELSVSSVYRSPAWIKLSYESQKPNSTVVSIAN